MSRKTVGCDVILYRCSTMLMLISHERAEATSKKYEQEQKALEKQLEDTNAGTNNRNPLSMFPRPIICTLRTRRDQEIPRNSGRFAERRKRSAREVHRDRSLLESQGGCRPQGSGEADGESPGCRNGPCSTQTLKGCVLLNNAGRVNRRSRSWRRRMQKKTRRKNSEKCSKLRWVCPNKYVANTLVCSNKESSAIQTVKKIKPNLAMNECNAYQNPTYKLGRSTSDTRSRRFWMICAVILKCSACLGRNSQHPTRARPRPSNLCWRDA